MYPGLSHGADAARSRNPRRRTARNSTYLTKLVSGVPGQAPCASPKSQCGSDLGLLRTKAEPNADGSYAITGTKIFISAGEHDMSDNIVHIVLARLPDAPEGTKRASRCSSCRSILVNDGRQRGRTQRCALRLHRGENGHSRPTRPACSTSTARPGLSHRPEPNRGLNCHVHLHEHGAYRHRHPGSCAHRAVLPGRAEPTPASAWRCAP